MGNCNSDTQAKEENRNDEAAAEVAPRPPPPPPPPREPCLYIQRIVNPAPTSFDTLTVEFLTAFDLDITCVDATQNNQEVKRECTKFPAGGGSIPIQEGDNLRFIRADHKSDGMGFPSGCRAAVLSANGEVNIRK